MSERDLVKNLLEQLVETGDMELRETLKLWKRQRNLDVVIMTLTPDQMLALRAALIDNAQEVNVTTAQRTRSFQAILDALVDMVIDAGVASLLEAIRK